MDGKKFDALTRRLSRRNALVASAAGLVTAAAVAPSRPAEAQSVSALRMPENCRRFAISGSATDIREDFNYDDDMTISVYRGSEKRVIWLDRDGEIGDNNLDVPPILFDARVGDELRVVARDSQPECYSLEAMYLHCCASQSCTSRRGDAQRLTRGVERKCVPKRRWKKSKFFDRTWVIGD